MAQSQRHLRSVTEEHFGERGQRDKRTLRGAGKNYLDVIVIDSKLSKGTSWSPNQIVAQSKEGWFIKSVKDSNIIQGKKINAFEYNASAIKNGNFKKIFKEGVNFDIN